MKKLFLFLVLGVCAFFPDLVLAQCPGLANLGIRPIPGHQEITVSSTAVGLTVPSSPTSFITRFALVSVKSNPIVTRDDGTDPTASVGILWNTGEKFIVCQSSLASFKAIRQSSDAVIGVSYFGSSQ